MENVSVRDLRNQGGRVLQRVVKSESFTITLDGEPVAEPRPLQSSGLSAIELLRRWQRFPVIDAGAFRQDIDSVIDSAL